MRMHTEFICLEIHWMISVSYHCQAHQHHPKKRCCFPTLYNRDSWCPLVCRWRLQVFVNYPRDVIRASRLIAGAPKCSQQLLKFSSSLQDVPILITMTSMVLLYHSSAIPVTPMVNKNALLGSVTLLKLVHLWLHSTSSQSLLESSSDLDTFCCWVAR
jgi:hypothetical protein